MNSTISSIIATVIAGLLSLLVFSLYKINNKLDAFENTRISRSPTNHEPLEHNSIDIRKTPNNVIDNGQYQPPVVPNTPQIQQSMTTSPLQSQQPVVNNQVQYGQPARSTVKNDYEYIPSTGNAVQVQPQKYQEPSQIHLPSAQQEYSYQKASVRNKQHQRPNTIVNNTHESSNRNNISTEQLSKKNKPNILIARKTSSRFSMKEYSVIKGDSLSKISQKTGLSEDTIMNLNQSIKDNPDKLQIGQVLLLPVR